MSLLELQDLAVEIRDDSGCYRELVSGVSLAIAPGKTLGLVGESGCGKSLTAMSILDLLPKPQARLSRGKVFYQQRQINGLAPKQKAQIRSGEIAVIFQDPMSALNPVQRIGHQITEALTLHFPKRSKSANRQRAIELLLEVGIPAAAERIDAYPHQLSGGMRQRVMIAMALSCEPKMLIADEPTTALDVTIQAQIVQLLKRLQREKGMAMLFITHDLALVSQLSDEIAVMYAGQLVEQNRSSDIFNRPRHPYTKGLLAALPGGARAPKSRLQSLEGLVPSVDAMPKGCRFANRCSHVTAICREDNPSLETVADGAAVACHHWREIVA